MGIKVRITYELDFFIRKKEYNVTRWYESDVDKSEEEKICNVQGKFKEDIDHEKIYSVTEEWLDRTDPRKDVIRAPEIEGRQRWEALPQETKSDWWRRLGGVVNEMDAQGVDSLWLLADYVSLVREEKQTTDAFKEDTKRLIPLKGNTTTH